MSNHANTQNKTPLMKVKTYFVRLIFIFSGMMTGGILRTYFDYKSHPAMYTEPYRTFSDILKSELTWYGAVILIAIIIVIVLSIIIKTNKQTV